VLFAAGQPTNDVGVGVLDEVLVGVDEFEGELVDVGDGGVLLFLEPNVPPTPPPIAAPRIRRIAKTNNV